MSVALTATATEPDSSERELPSLRRLVAAAVAVVVLGFGGLVGWAFVARLDGAVPGGGALVTQTKRKTVSLLDSGILRELRVTEGDEVVPGQLLLRLDDTQAQAALGQARAKLFGAMARTARLKAELADLAVVEFPPAVTEAARDPAIAALVDAEAQLFAARRETLDGTIEVQRRRIAQLEEQIRALSAQRAAYVTRLALTQEELRAVNTLLASGFATRNRALELRRTEAQFQGEIGELAGREAEARQAIAQTELEILSLSSTRRSDAARELQDAVNQIAESLERKRAAEDLLARSEVTAPEAGIVTDLRFFTPGSSIVAGQPVLDIVPREGSLVVEAALRPADVERVAVGQRVNVRITAFSHRRVPPLPGRLVYVGADRQINARGEPFFLVRAELDADATALLDGAVLAPGMPADVLVLQGERRAIDFLLGPLLDGMRRAMRES
jgi:HlyD family secretion protein